MGYHYINRPLMYSFGGKPFIDVRLSFNSLIPKEIGKNLKTKLIKYWSKKLIEKPIFMTKLNLKLLMEVLMLV